jgi:hypothetical protein
LSRQKSAVWQHCIAVVVLSALTAPRQLAERLLAAVPSRMARC